VRPVSVVVRARDEEAGIGRTLDLIAAQDHEGPVETIVVDSGSTDRTVAIAEDRGARVIPIPAASFTFGGALNTGCEAASGELIVALSAHAYPTDPAWLGRLVAAFDDERVACACGQGHGPGGEPLTAPLLQDAALARRHWLYGYSNAAGGFRADLWRERPWRTDMPGSEDKEWALHWMDRGRLTLIDPALCVEHDHSQDPLADQYRRARRELEGFAMMLDLPRYGLRDLAREWWTERDAYASPVRARLSHRRAVRLAGGYVGRRRAWRD
jgi:rhamnosyltransferase